MSGEGVRVVAKLTARPEKAEELGSVLLALVGPTRKEKGCITYELLRNKADSSDFVFVEEWTDDASLDAHLATPNLQEALARAKPLMTAAPDVRRYALFG